MAKLNITLFGKIGVECSRQESTIDSHKALELFCYLLLNQKYPQHRDSLAEVLWGDGSVNSKNYLRKTLWKLQQCLGEFQQITEHEPLLVESSWIQINPEADIWLDANVFENAYQQTVGNHGFGLSTHKFRSLQDSVELYRGDLLQGWQEDWCVFERERYKQMYVMMIDKLMSYCEARHHYEQGIEYGKEILRHDQARERTHRRLMRLYYLAGDRTEALRQFKRCKTILKHELDVEPSNRTLRLYQIIAKQPGVSQFQSTNITDPTDVNLTAETLLQIDALLGEQFSNHVRLANELQRLKQALHVVND